jgi:single-strand DNA-binding protein
VCDVAASVNRVVIVGNLVRDPELRSLPSGTSVCTLRVAVNSREKRDGNWQDYTSYFDVTVFGNQGDAAAQYLSKGRPVGVDGKLREDRWEKDGQKHSRIKVIADNVQFLGGRRDGDGGGGESSEFQAPVGATFDTGGDVDFGGDSDDDIPF